MLPQLATVNSSRGKVSWRRGKEVSIKSVCSGVVKDCDLIILKKNGEKLTVQIGNYAGPGYIPFLNCLTAKFGYVNTCDILKIYRTKISGL